MYRYGEIWRYDISIFLHIYISPLPTHLSNLSNSQPFEFSLLSKSRMFYFHTFFFHTLLNIKIVTNGRILVFEVSIEPY